MVEAGLFSPMTRADASLLMPSMAWFTFSGVTVVIVLISAASNA